MLSHLWSVISFHVPNYGGKRMKSCLVLLTKVFPFDKGEEFIEGEINALSKTFDKVILIATSVADNAVKTRSVPDYFLFAITKAV